MSNGTNESYLPRRSMMKMAGITLVGVWSQRALSTASQLPQKAPAASTSKPIFLAPDDATDAAVHSKVENLFWCDIMMEHARFFATLMPGLAVAAERAQAETFHRTFQTQYDRAKAAGFDRTNYAAFNRSTAELIKPFIEYKHSMREAQESGKIRTLVFPSFFDHTAREAERAATRLEKLAGGVSALGFNEVVDFWSTALSDHGQFVAHMLDPKEQDLIDEALDSSAVFKGFNQANRDRKVPGGDIILATEQLIDFETAIADGINSNRVKGILDPALADHMHRETLKFVDELKRTPRT